MAKAPKTKAAEHLDAGQAPAKEPADAWESNVYRILKSRLMRSEEGMKEWLAKGKAREEFIENMTGDAAVEAMLTSENGWIRSKVNKLRPLKQGILSNVAFKAPQVIGLPLKRDILFAAMANVESTYINRCIEESRFDRQQALVASDCIVYGASFMEKGTDPNKEGIPTARHRRVADVRVDTQAQQPDDQEWIAVREVMNVLQARKLFDCNELVGDSSEQKNTAKEGSGTTPEDRAATHSKTEPEDEVVTLWRFYLTKPASDFGAHVMKPKPRGGAKKAGTESRIQKMLREDGNKVVTICEKLEGVILACEPWPFIIEQGCLPVSIITIEDSPGRLLPESPLVSVLDQQKTLNNVYTFLVTQAFTMSKIKFAGDKDQLAQENTIEQKLRSPEVGTIIPVPGGFINLKAIELGPQGGLNQSMIQLFNLSMQMFDDISGFREMFGGMEGARSSAEAVIREGRSQTLTSYNRQVFDRGIKEVCLHLSQIAYSTSSAKLVAKWVGWDDMGFLPKAAKNAGKDPATLEMSQLISIFWDENKDAEAIRRESNTILLPGSTRRTNADKEVQDLQQVMVHVRDLLMLYQQNGYRIKPEILSKKLNYLLSRMLRAIGFYDYKQMELTGKDLNLEPTLLGKDINASIQAQIAEEGGKRTALEEIEEEKQESDEENVEALVEMYAAQGIEDGAARNKVAQLTPTQRAMAVELIQNRGRA